MPSAFRRAGLTASAVSAERSVHPPSVSWQHLATLSSKVPVSAQSDSGSRLVGSRGLFAVPVRVPLKKELQTRHLSFHGFIHDFHLQGKVKKKKKDRNFRNDFLGWRLYRHPSHVASCGLQHSLLGTRVSMPETAWTEGMTGPLASLSFPTTGPLDRTGADGPAG